MAASNPQERSPCVPDRTFEQLFSGAKLPEKQLAELDRHADECEECAERLADFGFRRGAQVRAAAGGAAVKRGPLEAGAVFDGRYRVEALLGSGGMGTIVRARDLKKNAEVALKLMRPERIGDATALIRFLREARATMSLDSPNAVRILDVGRTEHDAPYLVMESLRGRDLSRLVAASGPLSAERTIEYTLQALNAISEAHARGIVHRDLKPQNIFVTDAGLVKVLDFGLAKLLPTSQEPHGGPESHATRTNVLLGSPRYMSPEQIATPRDIDARADLWSMGAAMFHMLTGRPPFLEKNLLILATKIFSENAPRVTAFRPDVPTALEKVITKCMQRDRNRRYPNAASMAADLHAVLTHVQSLPILGTREISDEKVVAAVALASTIRADSRALLSAPPESGSIDLPKLNTTSESSGSIDLPKLNTTRDSDSIDLPKLNTTSVEIVAESESLPQLGDVSDEAELTVRMDLSMEAELSASARDDLPRVYDEEEEAIAAGKGGTVLLNRDKPVPPAPRTAPTLDRARPRVLPAAGKPAVPPAAPPRPQRPLLNTMAFPHAPVGKPPSQGTPPVGGGPPIPKVVPPFRDLQESIGKIEVKPSGPPPFAIAAVVVGVLVLLSIYPILRFLVFR